MIPINLVKLSSLIFFSLDTFGELSWPWRPQHYYFCISPLSSLDAFSPWSAPSTACQALMFDCFSLWCGVVWCGVVWCAHMVAPLAPHGTNHIFTGCRIDGPEVVILSEFHSDNCILARPVQDEILTRPRLSQAELVWPDVLSGCVDCDEILRLAARHTLSLPASRTTNDNINKICQDGSPRSPRLTIRHQTLSEILPPRFRFLILKLTLSTGTLARNIFDIFSRLNCTFVTVKIYLVIKILWTTEVSWRPGWFRYKYSW